MPCKRARRLSGSARGVASAAAVIGRSFDFDLLTAVTGTAPDKVAGALRELRDGYFVLPGADAASFHSRQHADPRHPASLMSAWPSGAACISGWRGLPRRAAIVYAFVGARFQEAGGQAGHAHRHAMACRCSSRLPRSRRTARRWNCTAWRRATCRPTRPRRWRVLVLAALGDEAAAADDNTAAAEATRTAHARTRRWLNDVQAAAALVRPMAAVEHLLGDDTLPPARRPSSRQRWTAWNECRGWTGNVPGCALRAARLTRWTGAWTRRFHHGGAGLARKPVMGGRMMEARQR